MRLHQFLGSLQHAFILAADQNQAAAVVSLDQVTHEFDSVHSRHIEVQQDQVWSCADIVYLGKGSMPVIAQRDRGEPHVGQHAR